VVVAGDDL
jgi:hypothetical protein